MQNKSEQYLRMIAYLEDMGADLGAHSNVRVASTFDEMDRNDLTHYQRVLEATIDRRDEELMDTDAMKTELTEVVRERFARGGVPNKTGEAKGFRIRIAAL